MEDPQVTDKKSYKYPLVATQLLESANKVVLAYFETRDKETKELSNYK